MHRMRWAPVLALIVALGAGPAPLPTANGEEAASPALTLPPALYGVVGTPIGCYFANLVRAERIDGLQFRVTGGRGMSDAERWLVTPAEGEVGDHPLTVTVKDAQGKMLGEARTVLRVAPREAGAGRPLRLLIVGDSVTSNGGGYPTALSRLLAAPGNPAWRMLGSQHRPMTETVRTEGYGGWRWETFLRRYEAQPDPAQRKISSPFVFASEKGAPEIDVARYIREQCEGVAPDVVTFLLGINDLAGLAASSRHGEDGAVLDRGIDAIFANAEALLRAFRAAAPRAALAVGIIPPANARAEAFEANYHGSLTRPGWKRMQHRMAERMIAHFRGREKDGIYLVPTELFLDPVGGFPENNAVHPNAGGHEQLAASFYSWLKWWLAAAPGDKTRQ